MGIGSGGILRMTDIATELGVSATGLSLNNAEVRLLAGKTTPGSAISYLDLNNTAKLTMVCGTDGGSGGHSNGFFTGTPSFGSLSPNNYWRGYQITFLSDYVGNPALGYFQITIAGGGHPQDFFKTLVINGRTYSSSNLGPNGHFNNQFSDSQWQWQDNSSYTAWWSNITPGNTYPIYLKA